jgi:hypothetical protein
MAKNNLKLALSLLHEFLEIRLIEVKDECRNSQNSLTRTQNELSKVQATRNTALQRIAALDTKELVELEVDGTHFYEHQFGIFHFTPNFNFNLSTRYHIRKVLASVVPSGSTWINFPEYTDTSTSKSFVATLKNKKTASLAAKVRLFGWSREVYGDELAKAQITEKEMQERAAELENEISAIRTLLRDKHALMIFFEDRLNVVEVDQVQVEQATGQQPSSTYTFSQTLGLNSNISQSWGFMPDVCARRNDSTAQNFLAFDQRNQQSFSCRLPIFIESVEKWKASASQTDDMIRLNTLRIMSTDQKNSKCRFLEEDLKCQDEEQVTGWEAIATPALKTLADMDKRLSALLERHISALTEIHDVGGGIDSMNRASEELREMDEETNLDMTTSENLSSLMVVEEMPIGVFASLMETELPIEAWQNIWNGVRDLLSKNKGDVGSILPGSDSAVGEGRLDNIFVSQTQ